jgi:hypothetical protein
MQTLVLEGKIFDRVKKIIEAPRARAYDKDPEQIHRNNFSKSAFMRSVLLSRAEDTQNTLTFREKCLTEIGKLFQYPTGESLPNLFWRVYFLDDGLELPAEMSRLFDEYAGNLEMEISVLKETSTLTQPQPIDTFKPGLFFTAVMIWLSKSLWKDPSSLGSWNHIYRLLICACVTFFMRWHFKKWRDRAVSHHVLRKVSRSFRFLENHPSQQHQTGSLGAIFASLKTVMSGGCLYTLRKATGSVSFVGTVSRLPFARVGLSRLESIGSGAIVISMA